MPQQSPIREAEDGHCAHSQSIGFLGTHGPGHSNDAGVEGKAVDLPALLDHSIEHQLGPWAVKSDMIKYFSKATMCISTISGASLGAEKKSVHSGKIWEPDRQFPRLVENMRAMTAWFPSVQCQTLDVDDTYLDTEPSRRAQRIVRGSELTAVTHQSSLNQSEISIKVT